MRTSLLSSLLGPRTDVGRRGGREALLVRSATPADDAAIERLAALDSSRPPRGAVLLAEVDGTPWAALSMDDQHAVADPFRPSGELVFLLMERGRGLRADRDATPRAWPTVDRPRLV